MIEIAARRLVPKLNERALHCAPMVSTNAPYMCKTPVASTRKASGSGPGRAL